MTRVPRQARRMEDRSTNPVDLVPEDLSAFRDLPAWVLLGEPGAGKTEALKWEAAAAGGEHLRIAEFIDCDLDEDWRGKPLFLDGLDEIRGGSGGDSTLVRVRRQLKRLGHPPFRIACRAADWYGSSDAENLKSAAADGQIVVLQLEPLGEEDILTLLRDNHGVTDPQAFVERAGRLGLEGLLGNPQTLGLLAQAIKGDQWPDSRNETYELACAKLAEEANKLHRDKTRARPYTAADLIDAAGQLCAVLLLSDQTGIALDADSADARFLPLGDCAPPDPEAAARAVGSNLFLPESVERFIPSHRSVAEYLAARWLARQIESAGLPLGRVLNLLLGQDGRTVAGLRGLYAWLTLHSLKARTRLIEADPLTVVLYGDVKPMPVADKRAVLAGLRREAQRYHGFRWGVRNTHPFGALADAELQEDFLGVLRAPERDDASQAFVDCVLDILAEGGASAELVATLPDLIRDPGRHFTVRKDALATWLALTTSPQPAITLLDDITAGRVPDDEDELTGLLLRHLYPGHLGPDVLLHYLHEPRNQRRFVTYHRFWVHDLPCTAPDEQLPALLDRLIGRKELRSHDPYLRRINKMADKLLVRGLAIYGDEISNERLYEWLGIGSDEYGGVRREDAEQQLISAWMKGRPERYKELLAICYSRCSQTESLFDCLYRHIKRLNFVTPPENMGLWHLERASITGNDALAKEHLFEAVKILMQRPESSGLSLEQLEVWGETYSERKHWLDPLLAWEIPQGHLEQVARDRATDQEREVIKRKRAIQISPHIPAIASGTAHSAAMHQLAAVWMDFYLDSSGTNPFVRFNNYSDNGPELLAASESGFRHCPVRDDLPSVNEIVGLAIKQEEHLIRLPCLVGMELRWRNGAGEIDTLPEETLRRMVAFRLTYVADDTPEWFTYLVRQRPALVAEVLTTYAGTTLKAGKEHVDTLYAMEHDPDYQAVATLAAPRLLQGFPVKARTGQLHYLENLLKAALRHAPEQLPALFEQKLALKGMDAAQRVYWLAAATLFNPELYESELWRHVGKSESRANHLAGFLGERLGQADQDYTLSAGTLGKLIERITPHAEVERPRGVHWVTDAMRRGDQIRALINRLGALTTPEAEQEISRLLGMPALRKLKPLLEATRHELLQRRRESEFRFLLPREVAQVLANQSPASIADLAALALDVLGDIARDIRQDNDDGFRAFWNVENKQRTSQREENLCRDTLLTRLRARLGPLGIDCQPEGDYANDKRADLRLSYLNQFELPIELKRDSNSSLWSALRQQLIDQYAIAPRAFGYGLYLVLWFGGDGMPRANDGLKKPRTPEELRTRLEAQLDPLEQRRIFVRILDVSWPQ